MINGEKIETTNYAPLFSPYSGEEIAQIAMADKELTVKAIDAAYNAREVMAKMPAYKRAEILEKVVTLLKENADERVTYLRSKGIESFIDTVTVSGETWYRVQAGAFSSRENAEMRLTEVKNAGINDAYIVAEK
jgi:delta 1-pyrroline-5-carboxylate dehydrogenase